MKPTRVILAVAILTACAKHTRIPFTGDVNKPIFDSQTTPFCQKSDNGEYITTVTREDGKLGLATEKFIEADPDGRAFGGTCVLRPLREVWAVALNTNAMAMSPEIKVNLNRIKPSSLKVSNPIDQSIVYHAYIGSYHGCEEMGCADWAVQWWDLLRLGTYKNPQRVDFNFFRSAGDRVKIFVGTVKLGWIAPKVTSFAMDLQMDPAPNGYDNMIGLIREYYQRLNDQTPNWKDLDSTQP